jgi:hypothetical protein
MALSAWFYVKTPIESNDYVWDAILGLVSGGIDIPLFVDGITGDSKSRTKRKKFDSDKRAYDDLASGSYNLKKFDFAAIPQGTFITLIYKF